MKALMIMLIWLAACQVDNSLNKEYAKTVTYYFDIVQNFSSKEEMNLASEISELMDHRKYAITEESGGSWPFFQTFNADDEILKTDLMKPHVAGHSFVSIEHQESIKNDDVKLNIKLNEQGGDYSFDMVIWKCKNGDWVKVVDTGNHKISKNKYESKEDLTQVLYKSIVRYSFK